jgi:hypothetical protein
MGRRPSIGTVSGCDGAMATYAAICLLSSAIPRWALNNSFERKLRPTGTYRKVTGGFRSVWGTNFFAAVRSIISSVARCGIDTYRVIRLILQGVYSRSRLTQARER